MIPKHIKHFSAGVGLSSSFLSAKALDQTVSKELPCDWAGQKCPGDYVSLVFGGAANLLGKEGLKRNIIYRLQVETGFICIPQNGLWPTEEWTC